MREKNVLLTCETRQLCCFVKLLQQCLICDANKLIQLNHSISFK